MKSFRLLLLLSLFILSGCNFRRESSMKNDVPSVDRDSAQQIESNTPIEVGSDVNGSEVEGKVSMSVLADSEGNFDITVINNSDVDIEMSENFALQKIDGEIWKHIPLSLTFIDSLIIISPGESHVFHFDIGSAVALERNTIYRIEKVVSAGKINYSVFASFEIQ